MYMPVEGIITRISIFYHRETMRPADRSKAPRRPLLFHRCSWCVNFSLPFSFFSFLVSRDYESLGFAYSFIFILLRDHLPVIEKQRGRRVRIEDRIKSNVITRCTLDIHYLDNNRKEAEKIAFCIEKDLLT